MSGNEKQQQELRSPNSEVPAARFEDAFASPPIINSKETVDDEVS